MFRTLSTWTKKITLAALIILAMVRPAHAQMGIVLTGAGPINRSMGGTAVATPLDATGSLYWNPATMSALPSSSIDFGVEMLVPQAQLGSSIPGLGAGVTRGDLGAFALPSMSLVYTPEGSLISYGLGVYAMSGFGTNYPSSGTNPILTPQPPNGGGLGSIYSNMSVMQMTPNASFQLTERLSVGLGPTLTMANLSLDPLLLTNPNTNGAYPTGTHSRMNWGGGFQIGAFYKLDSGLNFGASFKSTQWMDAFHYQTVNATGAPREATYRFNIPSITSVGVGYTGIERWTLGADFRYLDYRNTDGFGPSGYTPTGAVAGLGWRSIFAMSLGAQYQMTEAFSVRMGYSYNQNPISDAQSAFNVFSPTILSHGLSLGFSYRVTEALSLSFAYAHFFETSIEGPLVLPTGPVAGTAVRNTVSADTFILGATVLFGPRCAMVAQR